ncbi:MAG TPA: sulfurtransferase [Stenotrophomonas sp.]|jgi:thiosulfate/3-mercaptopyruvate sulfurtransferase
MTQTWQTLVDPQTLAPALGRADLRLLDARFAPATVDDPTLGRRAWAQSHLSGARYADLNGELSDLSRTGVGRHPLPNEADFAAALGRWGVTPQTQVVVYDAADGSMAASRLWWLLRLMGHRAVAVLDGGIAAWRVAGLPETSDPIGPPAAPSYPAGFDADQIVDAAQVQARLAQPPGWLIDVRAPERFAGQAEPIDPVAGHVPGAVNRPLAKSLSEGRFLSAQALRADLLPYLQGRDPREVVLMCGSGVTACHTLLAMEHAGLGGARVYAGSWSGWISDPARPVATGS